MSESPIVYDHTFEIHKQEDPAPYNTWIRKTTLTFIEKDNSNLTAKLMTYPPNDNVNIYVDLVNHEEYQLRLRISAIIQNLNPTSITKVKCTINNQGTINVTLSEENIQQVIRNYTFQFKNGNIGNTTEAALELLYYYGQDNLTEDSVFRQHFLNNLQQEGGKRRNTLMKNVRCKNFDNLQSSEK